MYMIEESYRGKHIPRLVYLNLNSLLSLPPYPADPNLQLTGSTVSNNSGSSVKYGLETGLLNVSKLLRK